MKASYYALLVVVAAVTVALLLALGGLFASSHRISVIFWAVGYMFVAALLVRIPVRMHVQSQMIEVESAIRNLPNPVSVKEGIAPDFKAAIEEAGKASARLQRSLSDVGRERAQLEALLDSMQDAVVAVDSSGRIQWTNQKMQRLLPGRMHAAAGGAVRVGHALVQTIRDPDVLECVRLALEEGAVSERRATTLMPGRKFEVNASPMPGGGAVAVLHDITRIEEVEQTQRDFVANVSHELRTPLTSITGYVETLLDHEASLSAQARDFLGTILKNATRMTRLTEDLLVMARVEGPSGELRPAPVRADVLVRDAVEAMQGMVQEHKTSLEIGAMTTTQVFADTDAVMQVLANLIENAVKYGQSKVVISAQDLEGQYELVEFSVKDFGAGIPSEHLERIFERFYRVDKTRSRESGGTGLGLAIARHMVQTQGGTIRAESRLGSGSTFLFTLPKALYPLNSLDPAEDDHTP